MEGDEPQWETAGDDPLSFSLVKTDDKTISGLLLNATGAEWKVEPRPQLTLSFEPAELLKFEMPSVPAPKDMHGPLIVPAKSSVEIIKGVFKSSRWVFQWASDTGERTHQCSYTVHPKGCKATIRVEHLGVGHFLEESLDL